MKPTRKHRKPDQSSKLVLQEVIGLTTRNANGLASSISSKSCVYVAGCVVVVYDVDAGIQSHLMVSHRMPKPLSAVAVSLDGRYVAAGESGNHSSVLLWDCANMTFLSELKGHMHGVSCIAFSPDGNHLVAVGGYIHFWDWRSGSLVTKLKASSSCSAIASVTFSSNAKYILTAGNKHLKLWSVALSPPTRFNSQQDSLALHGKPMSLGLQRGQSFVSAICPIWINHQPIHDGFPIYALTEAGVLCVLDSGSVRKSVDLKVEKGFCLSASDRLIACGCSNGLVQLIVMETLKYAGTLSYSMSKQCHEWGNACCVKPSQKDLKLTDTLPDAVACQFSALEKLVVFYGDHSLYIWDIHDANKAVRCCVLVSHSACIWDIKNLCCENAHDPFVACAARGCCGGVSFATCSADGTIRLWDFLLQPDSSEDTAHRHSLVSHLVSAGIFERDTIEPGLSAHGFRSMAVSSDGEYMATGDNDGNLYIYNLNTSEYTCIEGAHDAEILSLSFSSPSKKDTIQKGCGDNKFFLVSGGRDRVVCLYDVERNFDLLESVDDHSAAVTSVKLVSDGCKLLSCSADRSLVFRNITVSDGCCKVSCGHRQMASKGTVYDMALDPLQEVAVTVGQDKKINVFDVASGKLRRSFTQDRDCGDPVKVFLDPSCNYIICSGSDKLIRIYDFKSGEMVTQTAGHGEVVTGVIFLPDCKHIISVGGDGCIFVWKVPSALSLKMLQGIEAKFGPLSLGSLVQTAAFRQIISSEKEEKRLSIYSQEMLLYDSNQAQGLPDLARSLHGASAFSFSVSRLPKWAQTKVVGIASPKIIPSEEECRNIQTPNKSDIVCSQSSITHISGGTDISSYQSSISPQKSDSIFGPDKRWRTVYTVCMDLRNSPGVWQEKDDRTPVISLFEDTGHLPGSNEAGYKMPVCNECQFEVLNDESGKSRVTLENEVAEATSSDIFQRENEHNVSCQRMVADDVSEQSSAERIERELQEEGNISDCCMKSEDSLFDQHFGSLSATQKIERTEPSSRRRYSARYVVRRSYLGGWKNFDSLCEELDREHSNNEEDEANIHNHDILKGSNCKIVQELSIGESCHQKMKKPKNPISSYCTCLANESEMPGLIEATERNISRPREKEVEDRINECSKALLHLESATDTAARLLADVVSLVTEEELSNGSGAGLYKAAELLPSIEEKVHRLSRFLKLGSSNSSGRN